MPSDALSCIECSRSHAHTGASNDC